MNLLVGFLAVSALLTAGVLVALARAAETVERILATQLGAE